MIDRIDTHPTPNEPIYIEQRSGRDRRKIYTMLDPAVERRKGDRRKKDRIKSSFNITTPNQP